MGLGLAGLFFGGVAGCRPPELAAAPETSAMRIEIRFDSELRAASADGRVLVVFAPDDGAPEEPRARVRPGVKAVQVFGLNVEAWAPGVPAVIDEEVLGYPILSLADVPPGDYQAQAVLHLYETFELSTGHTVKLPMDRGEGQKWSKAPGNLYSTPQKVRVEAGGEIQIQLDQIIPPIPPPQDTKYIRHLRMKSERLSAFWGRDMYLGAHVLVPEGFDEHPEARYPLVIFHGHYPDDFGGFRTEPPNADLKPKYSERFGVEGYNRVEQQEAYDFYRKWTGEDFPRFLIVELQHPTPYYDDSYAVNSASQGPWGDALTYELIPFIEKEMRGLGEGWARFMYGGSTGGWEVLA
ncbi:MAG: hypothetical protein AAFU79_31305, partial [Myxococcota bacterium]